MALKLTAIYEPFVYTRCGNLDVLTTLWAFTAYYRDTFTYFYLYLRQKSTSCIINVG
jgi:hypothetical protein